MHPRRPRQKNVTSHTWQFAPQRECSTTANANCADSKVNGPMQDRVCMILRTCIVFPPRGPLPLSHSRKQGKASFEIQNLVPFWRDVSMHTASVSGACLPESHNSLKYNTVIPVNEDHPYGGTILLFVP